MKDTFLPFGKCGRDEEAEKIKSWSRVSQKSQVSVWVVLYHRIIVWANLTHLSLILPLSLKVPCSHIMRHAIKEGEVRRERRKKMTFNLTTEQQ